eukprot:4298983-Ditylum_brightwellii.AAC.1
MESFPDMCLVGMFDLFAVEQAAIDSGQCATHRGVYTGRTQKVIQLVILTGNGVSVGIILWLLKPNCSRGEIKGSGIGSHLTIPVV